MVNSAPTLEDARSFWPGPNVCDGFAVSDLLVEVRQFALATRADILTGISRTDLVKFFGVMRHP